MSVSIERSGTNIQKVVLHDTRGFAEQSAEVDDAIAELFANTKLRVVQLTGFLSADACARLTEDARPLLRHASGTQVMGMRRMTDLVQAGSSRARYGKDRFAEYSQERLWGNDAALEAVGARFAVPERVHALIAGATGLAMRRAQEESVALNDMVFRHINSADLHTDDVRTRVKKNSELQHIVTQCSWNLFFCITARGGSTNVYDGGLDTPREKLAFLEQVSVKPQTGDLVLMNTASLHEVEGAYDGLRLSASGMTGMQEQANHRRLLSWT